MSQLYWESQYAIALALIERYPNQDPEQTGLHELADLITSLSNFCDDPALATERILKDIQITWFEEKASL
ncbi:MAG: Fe-S cluster assembly protein IscX [Chloroflexota bacterium]